MRTAANLHPNQAWRQLIEKRIHLRAFQLFAQYNFDSRIDPVHLKNCESRPSECEPVTHHTQDLNFIVVRAYKRSCEYVDSVIKIGGRSNFCAYRALTAGQPISAASAVT